MTPREALESALSSGNEGVVVEAFTRNARRRAGRRLAEGLRAGFFPFAPVAREADGPVDAEFLPTALMFLDGVGRERLGDAMALCERCQGAVHREEDAILAAGFGNRAIGTALGFGLSAGALLSVVVAAAYDLGTWAGVAAIGWAASTTVVGFRARRDGRA